MIFLNIFLAASFRSRAGYIISLLCLLIRLNIEVIFIGIFCRDLSSVLKVISFALFA